MHYHSRTNSNFIPSPASYLPNWSLILKSLSTSAEYSWGGNLLLEVSLQLPLMLVLSLPALEIFYLLSLNFPKEERKWTSEPLLPPQLLGGLPPRYSGISDLSSIFPSHQCTLNHTYTWMPLHLHIPCTLCPCFSFPGSYLWKAYYHAIYIASPFSVTAHCSPGSPPPWLQPVRSLGFLTMKTITFLYSWPHQKVCHSSSPILG